MSSNNSSMPNPRLPALTAATLDEDLRNSGAPALTTTLDSLLLEHNEPHSDAEIATWDAMWNQIYPEIDPTSTIALGPGPQLSPNAREPTNAVTTALRERSLERLLAPAPTGQETKPRHPVPSRRNGLPRKGVSGRTIEKKVDQACSRCRRQKQKCDGEKPHCRRCTRKNQSCTYVLSQWQIECARKKAAETANAMPEFFEQPGPVETAPAQNRYLALPGRRLLPQPGAPGATFGGLTAGPGGRMQDSEDPNWAFEGFTAGPIGHPQYPEDPYLASGGFTPGLNGYFLHPQEPDLRFRGSNTWSAGPLQRREEPGWAVDGLETWPNGLSQNSQRPGIAYGGYPPQVNGYLPVLEEPVSAFGGSVAPPNGISPYTRNPSMASVGPTPWSAGLLPNPNESETEFRFNGFLPTRPGNEQNPIGPYHVDDQHSARAHFAEWDPIGPPGTRRT